MKVGASPGYVEQLQVLTKRLPWTAADLTVTNIDSRTFVGCNWLEPAIEIVR